MDKAAALIAAGVDAADVAALPGYVLRDAYRALWKLGHDEAKRKVAKAMLFRSQQARAPTELDAHLPETPARPPQPPMSPPPPPPPPSVLLPPAPPQSVSRPPSEQPSPPTLVLPHSPPPSSSRHQSPSPPRSGSPQLPPSQPTTSQPPPSTPTPSSVSALAAPLAAPRAGERKQQEEGGGGSAEGREAASRDALEAGTRAGTTSEADVVVVHNEAPDDGGVEMTDLNSSSESEEEEAISSPEIDEVGRVLAVWSQGSTDRIARAQEIFRVKASASAADIKKAYRKLQLRVHPDKCTTQVCIWRTSPFLLGRAC